MESNKSYGSINSNEVCNERSRLAFPSSVSWHKWRRWLFPIEIFICLLMFLILYSGQIYKQYIFQRLAKETLTNLPNYTAPTMSLCLKQDYIVNLTTDATFLHLQKRANDISMYCEVISLGTSAIMAFFYGSLSDIIGRKLILGLCLFGVLLCSIVQVVVIELDINIYWMLLSLALYGMLGGTSTILGVSFASVTDITTNKWRTLRLGIAESAMGFGRATSYLIAYDWINWNGCNFRGPAYLMIGCSVIAFVYLVLLPESLPQDRRMTKNEVLHKLVNSAKIFLIPAYRGFSKWWRICVAVAIISLECLSVVGVEQIMNYFLHDKPLEWSYDLIGIYGVITSFTMVAGLIVVLPILLALHFSNQCICLVAITFAVVSNILMATVKTDWEMYLAGGLQSFQQIGFPAVRAILAGLIDPKDYGSVLTITASIQLLASIGSTVLFNEVYHPQAEVNGHHINAGIVFWITAGFWAVAIPLVLSLIFKTDKDHLGNTKDRSENESEHSIK